GIQDGRTGRPTRRPKTNVPDAETVPTGYGAHFSAVARSQGVSVSPVALPLRRARLGPSRPTPPPGLSTSRPDSFLDSCRVRTFRRAERGQPDQLRVLPVSPSRPPPTDTNKGCHRPLPPDRLAREYEGSCCFGHGHIRR